MGSIFKNEAEETAVAVIKQTMRVFSEDGVAYVSFAANKGKGSGAQTIPVSEFAECVEALSEIVENGISEEEEHISTPESIRRTASLSDGTISFRVRSGKGAKPAKIAVGELADVVKLFKGCMKAVESHAKDL
ncbi:MAG: hypothetical protein QF913_07850 [Nitrospinaceae bacterium]|jgi:hypothetical protein|nr:hypothetical protein [Nitrospinaceae bacterium]